MTPRKALSIAAACGVVLAAAPAVAHAADDPTHSNCLVKGNGLCGGASLNGQHIVVQRGRRFHLRLYWPYPSNLVTTFKVDCARPRGATVIYAKVGNTDHAWIRTCRHTYKVGIS